MLPALCPSPHALCPMLSAPCPLPHALRAMLSAPCPLRYALCPLRHALRAMLCQAHSFFGQALHQCVKRLGECDDPVVLELLSDGVQINAKRF